MMEAAPTVTPRSVAICGSSESADRTMAWLAKPATARNTMARVGLGGWDKADLGLRKARLITGPHHPHVPEGTCHSRMSLRSCGRQPCTRPLTVNKTAGTARHHDGESLPAIGSGRAHLCGLG